MFATLVSMYPFPLEERKPSLVPTYFMIPAAEDGDFVVVHIEDAYTIMEDALGTKNKIPIFPIDIAKSIINDFVLAKIYVSPTERPGMFCVEGKLTKKQISDGFPDELEEQAKFQKNWYRKLVDIADDEFNRTKQTKVVTELQRAAAKFLGLDDRPWLSTYVADNTRCKFCVSSISVAALVCPICRNVQDMEKFKAAGGVMV